MHPFLAREAGYSTYLLGPMARPGISLVVDGGGGGGEGYGRGRVSGVLPAVSGKVKNLTRNR